MKTKKGFIVKVVWFNGHVHFHHLLPNEIHLIKKILKESDKGKCEILETTFTSDNDFLTQRF